MTGFDLTRELHQKEVVRYVVENEPLVVIFGPPCIGFGHWPHFNMYIHPEAWSKSREIDEFVVASVARICGSQLGANRHLLAEKPA